MKNEEIIEFSILNSKFLILNLPHHMTFKPNRTVLPKALSVCLEPAPQQKDSEP